MKLKFIISLILTLCFFGAIGQNSKSKKTVLFDDCYQLTRGGVTYAECVDEYGFIPTTSDWTVCSSGSIVMTDAGTIFHDRFTISGTLEGKNGNSIPFNYSEIFSERNIYKSESYIVTFKTGGPLGGGLALEADVSVTVYVDGTLITELRNTKVVCR